MTEPCRNERHATRDLFYVCNEMYPVEKRRLISHGEEGWRNVPMSHFHCHRCLQKCAIPGARSFGGLYDRGYLYALDHNCHDLINWKK
jgi:hypothetical protein